MGFRVDVNGVFVKIKKKIGGGGGGGGGGSGWAGGSGVDVNEE